MVIERKEYFQQLLGYKDKKIIKVITGIRRCGKGKMMYLILDEIQNVREFQRVVDSFFIKDNIDIYITGSNSYMLSGELATLLSGRYVKIQMLPFSFAEFVRAFHMEDQLERVYQRYIETSSFPYTIQLGGGTGQINDYLRAIYDTIILKDIISRKKITDVMMLESVIRFLADYIGNLLESIFDISFPHIPFTLWT